MLAGVIFATARTDVFFGAAAPLFSGRISDPDDQRDRRHFLSIAQQAPLGLCAEIGKRRRSDVPVFQRELLCFGSHHGPTVSDERSSSRRTSNRKPPTPPHSATE
jgi:hypothetical protein